MAKTNAQMVMEQAMHGQPVKLDWMEDDTPAKQEPAVDPVKALELQIAELKGQVMAGQSRVDASGYTPPAIRPNVSTTPDFSKLPDPVAAPQEYAMAVQTAINTAAQNKAYLDKWDAEQYTKAKTATNKLHADFKKKYPDYAKNQKAVELFAEEAVEDAVAGGLDANRYMFAQREQFFKDVVAKMDEGGFGKKPLEAAEGDDDGEAANRASGIPDGSQGGGPGKAAKAEAPASMFSGLNKWRSATGHIA